MITFSDPSIQISFSKTGNEDAIIKSLESFTPTAISGKFTCKFDKKSKALKEILDWLHIIEVMNELEKRWEPIVLTTR